MKARTIALCCLLLAACAKEPMETKPSNNPNVPVSLLLEIDGCRVYRFLDAGHYRYFASCPGSVSWGYSTSNGKTATRHQDSITTDSRGRDDAR